MSKKSPTLEVPEHGPFHLVRADNQTEGLREILAEGRDLLVCGPVGAGKTETFRWLALERTASGQFAAVLASCARPTRRWRWATDGVVQSLREAAQKLPQELRPPPGRCRPPGEQLRSFLTAWARSCPRPLLVFLDDLDQIDWKLRKKVLRQSLTQTAKPEAPRPALLAFIGTGWPYQEAWDIEREVLTRKGSSLSKHDLAWHVEMLPRTPHTFVPERGASQPLSTPRESRYVALPEGSERQAVRIPTPERSPDRRPLPPERPQPSGLWAILACMLMLLSAAGLFWWARSSPPAPMPRNSPPPPSSPREIARADIDRFRVRCSDAAADATKFLACRKELPSLQSENLWISTQYLLRQDQKLRVEDLDDFYGLSGPRAKAERMALASILIAGCRRGVLLSRSMEASNRVTFADLIAGCQESLPTLERLGLDQEDAADAR
jgi:hypothetical protein